MPTSLIGPSGGERYEAAGPGRRTSWRNQSSRNPAGPGGRTSTRGSRSVPEGTLQPDHFGPEPEDNQPGHHPVEEQDQPPLDEFAARFGITSESSSDDTDGNAGASPSDDGTAQGAIESAQGDEHQTRERLRPVTAAVRRVWVVTVRWGVLPALGGVRSATDVMDRAACRTIR